MVTIFISIAAAIAAVIACTITEQNTGSTIGFGISSFIVPQIIIGILARKRMGRVKDQLEEIVIGGQKRMTRKVQMFQSKPGGNFKQLQRQIEADQLEVVTQALRFVDKFEPFKKWNLLTGKQIATMRLQFHYQLKEFEKVDALLAIKNPLASPALMEPLLVAMKIARQYKNGDLPAAEKTFKKRVRWYRGNRGSLLYGLMSWIYMKEGRSEDAHLLLGTAKDKTGDEVLTRNWEMLSNRKEKQFSNSGLGDEWYGLYLENPPAPKQQRMKGNAKGRRF